jgi:hypothetical protein
MVLYIYKQCILKIVFALTENWQKYVLSLKNLHKIPLVETRNKSVFMLLGCDTQSLGKSFPTCYTSVGHGICDPEDEGTMILCTLETTCLSVISHKPFFLL